MIRTRTPIRNHTIMALAATMCFATGAQSTGGMNQPLPAKLGGGQVSDPIYEEGKPEDADFSEEAEKWRAEHGKTSARPVSTNTEPEGGAATATSAGMELGEGEQGDHLTAQQAEHEETDEEKQERLKPAPTHFGHRLQSAE